MPRNRKLDAEEGAYLNGGMKSTASKPEPLVGADRKTTEPVDQAKRKAGDVQRWTDLDTHGAPAVVDQAVERAVEADEAAPKDHATSAEAVDQGNVRPIDIERAELDAASHAERLAVIEDEAAGDDGAAASAGSESGLAFALGVTAAGDREGDHTANVRKATAAAAKAAEDGDSNVARARAFASLESVDKVESPHGRTAEEHDPWVAARWAPHGDQNIPAVSYGPEAEAVFGDSNPQVRDQVRGLEGDSDQDVREAKREAGGRTAPSIARERSDENHAAARVAKEDR